MTADDDRQARLAAALRANLRRRKAPRAPSAALQAPEGGEDAASSRLKSRKDDADDGAED
jgi:hypothetical protein